MKKFVAAFCLLSISFSVHAADIESAVNSELSKIAAVSDSSTCSNPNDKACRVQILCPQIVGLNKLISLSTAAVKPLIIAISNNPSGALSESEIRSKVAAAVALGEIGDETALESLTALSKIEEVGSNSMVINAAKNAIAKFNGDFEKVGKFYLESPTDSKTKLDCESNKSVPIQIK